MQHLRVHWRQMVKMTKPIGLLLIAAPIVILISALGLISTRPDYRPRLTPAPGLPEKFQTAGDLYIQAISLDPSNQDAYDALVSLYTAVDETTAADAVWDAAAEANPDAPWPRVAQAELRRQLGDFAGQLDALERAASIDDGNVALQAEVTNLRRIVASQSIARDYAAKLDQTGESTFMFTPIMEMLADGWALVGTLTAPSTLLSGGSAPLWAFWQAPSSDTELFAGVPAQGWTALGDGVWVQETGRSAQFALRRGFRTQQTAGFTDWFSGGSISK